jgi:hypothetical protein
VTRRLNPDSPASSTAAPMTLATAFATAAATRLTTAAAAMASAPMTRLDGCADDRGDHHRDHRIGVGIGVDGEV